MYAKFSDHELINHLKLDKEPAYKEIYKRYWQSIFLVAKNRLGNQHDAEELVQDIFCNLWNRRHALELKTTLNAYLSVSLKYEIINLMAKRKREREFKEHQLAKQDDKDLTTIQQVQINELLARIEQSIALLPERSQLVFKLRFESGYSQKKIAEELQISEKTVESHISKVRKHLRTNLGSVSLIAFSHLSTYFASTDFLN